MSNIEILSLVVTLICLLSFSAVFTVLFRYYFKYNIANIEEGKEDISLIDQAIIDEQKAKNKTKKVFSILGKTLTYILFAIILLFLTFSIINRFNDNLMINDTSVVVIASGSMEKKNPENTYLIDNNLNNQIATYDVITIKKVNNPEDIKLYDIIAFKNNNNVTIVHRVVRIDIVDNQYHFLTQGDANNTDDSQSQYGNYLTFDKIVGKYTGTKIPMVGIFIIFLQSGAGIITIIAIIYCYFMFDHYRSKYEKAIQERTLLLTDLIKDFDDIEESITNTFHQELIYKGYRYIFENGKFISKEEADTEEGTMKVIDNINGEIKVNEKTINSKKKE